MKSFPDSQPEHTPPRVDSLDTPGVGSGNLSPSPLTAVPSPADESGWVAAANTDTAAAAVPPDAQIRRVVGKAAMDTPSEPAENIDVPASAEKTDGLPAEQSANSKPPTSPKDARTATPEDPSPKEVSPPADQDNSRETPDPPAETPSPTSKSSPKDIPLPPNLFRTPMLDAQLSQAIDRIGAPALRTVLAASERFDQRYHTSTQETPDGTKEYTWHTHRHVLKKIPDLAQAATDVQLSPDQAGELAAHAVDAIQSSEAPRIPNNFTVIGCLTTALRASAEIGEVLTPPMVAHLRTLINKAGEHGAIDQSLAAYSASRRAGLSMEQGLQLVSDYLDAPKLHPFDHQIHHLTRALQTFDAAKVPPEDLIETFDYLRQLNPTIRPGAYEQLRQKIIFEAPEANLSPAEGIRDLLEQVNANIAGATTPHLPETDSEAKPERSRDQIFPEVPGKLENRPTPFRTVRSLGDGMRDMERLTYADASLGEPVLEGFWIFDPAAHTWYSYGGETRYFQRPSQQPNGTSALARGIQHNRGVDYDMSKLSSQPYFFHIHPTENPGSVSEYSKVLPSPADYRAAAGLLIEAQNKVPVRPFISHPFGFTEFTVPQDPAAIDVVAEIFAGVCSNFFRRFSSSDEIQRTVQRIGRESFVRDVCMLIATQLPEGFGLRFYPPGTDWDTLQSTH